MGFNCTFMELKSHFEGVCTNRYGGFNRTFMELKFGKAFEWDGGFLALIVSLWN